MLSTIGFVISKNNSEIVISRMVYCQDQFFGPYIEFEKTEYTDQKKSVIKFTRDFAEDARYADKTQLQLAVEALSELSAREEVTLKFWGREVKIPQDSDQFEVQEILIEFILRNVKLT